MSVAVRPGVMSSPEIENNQARERSVHYIEHGFPCPLVRWHCHDDYELHLIVCSSGKAFVGDHIGTFGPGNLVLTGPCLPHNWISQVAPNENIELRDRVVQFNEHLVPGIAALAPELQELLPLLERSRFGVEFDVDAARAVEPSMIAIRDNDGPERLSLLIDVLLYLSRQTRFTLLSTMPLRAEQNDAMLDKVERVTRHVTEHYASDLTLAGVAALVGMQESAFSRFFSRATGNGFNRFVNRMRISKACELLTTSDHSITDICFEVGFKNVANFNRRFRELKGVTPREYRKQLPLRYAPLLHP